MKNIFTKTVLIAAALGLSAPLFAQFGPDPDEVQIKKVSYSGAGCPQGSIDYLLSEDAQAITVLFDEFFVEMTRSEKIKRTNCDLAIKFHVPKGWSYRILNVDYAGYAAIERYAKGTQLANYRFNNTGPFLSLGRTNMMGPFDDDYEKRVKVPTSSLNWSNCRTTDSVINLRTSLVLEQTRTSGRNYSKRGSGLLTVDSIDGELVQTYGLNWKPCKPQAQNLKPIYHFDNGRDHFYTVSKSEGVRAGYTSRGVGFYLHAQQKAGLKPLYRCYHPRYGDHFASADPGCDGFGRKESLLGYAWKNNAQGTKALYKCRLRQFSGRSVSRLDTLMTTNLGQCPGGLNQFQNMGLVGYVKTP